MLGIVFTGRYNKAVLLLSCVFFLGALLTPWHIGMPSNIIIKVADGDTCILELVTITWLRVIHGPHDFSYTFITES